jgi:hypothetical protein
MQVLRFQMWGFPVWQRPRLHSIWNHISTGVVSGSGRFVGRIGTRSLLICFQSVGRARGIERRMTRPSGCQSQEISPPRPAIVVRMRSSPNPLFPVGGTTSGPPRSGSCPASYRRSAGAKSSHTDGPWSRRADVKLIGFDVRSTRVNHH